MEVKANLISPQRIVGCTDLEDIAEGSILSVNNTQIAVSNVNQEGDNYQIETLRRDLYHEKEAIFVVNYEATQSELKQGTINDTKSACFPIDTTGFRPYSEKLRHLELKNKKHPW